MKQHIKCDRCNKDFYASYKGKYYCAFHLEQVLLEEKRIISNNDNNKN